MKLQKAWDAKDAAAGTASSVARQLGLAGIAVVWLLAGGLQTSGVHLTTQLLRAGFALVVSLFLDLLQYLVPTLLFAWWARRKEKEKQGWKAKNWYQKGDHAAWNRSMVVDEEDVGGFPDWFNPAPWWFFWLKMAGLIYAYVLILSYLWDRIVFP
jgi:hypothetical protein